MSLFLAIGLDARFLVLKNATQATLWQMPPMVVLILMGLALTLGISGY